MKSSKFIVSILKQQEADLAVANICRERGISAVTFYKWRSKYGGNCPAFIAQAMMTWAAGHDAELAPIQPGKPTQNAYVERFNRTFR